ncbi:ferredoxin [Candidatus Woesearchaeota archaeon]|nr:ferredoxin [Candidatus Woesearchaeota archaeon]
MTEHEHEAVQQPVQGQKPEHKEESAPVAGKRYKVIFERPGCIGAAACAAVAPQFWEIVSDGKADLTGAKRLQNNEIHELEIDEKDLAVMKDAAEACPVTVIHIEDKKTGKRII